MAGPSRSRLRSSQVQRIKVHPHRWSSELEDTSDDEGDHLVNDDSSKLITSDNNGNHSVNDDYSKLIETSALHISEATIASNKPAIAANARSDTNSTDENIWQTMILLHRPLQPDPHLLVLVLQN